MSAHWFYAPRLKNGRVALDSTEVRHARQSLRLRDGDAVTLFDGCGRIAEGRLCSPESVASASSPRRGVEAIVEIISVHESPPPTRTLTVFVAGCKGPRLGVLIEKCTELGASHVALCDFTRSIVRVSESHVEKLLRTAIESCKQCRRPWLPRISSQRSVQSAVQKWLSDSTSCSAALFIAHPDANAPWLGPALLDSAALANFAVVIGPEGGLTDAEILQFRHLGARSVRLAESILRVETAAIAVAAAWAACGITTDGER